MKNRFEMSVLLTGALLLTVCCTAQQPPAVPPPPPLSPNGPAAPAIAPPPMRPGGVIQLTTLTGTVSGYTANDRYEYDALQVQTTDKTVTVVFPPHLGAQIMKEAPRGNQVSITGAMEETPEGSVFHFYSLQTRTGTITDTPPALEQNPPAEQIKSFQGTITELNHDKRGMINGIVLDNKMLVLLPPPAVEQLLPSLKSGTAVSGTGISRAPNAGVAMSVKREVTDARTLSVAGQTFLMR